MAQEKYIKLSGNYYFDPVKRQILRKQGSTYFFVRLDRRNFQKPVTRDRRDRFDAMPIQLKPIAQGLYWDAEHQDVYRKVGENFVLYSKNRRKATGKSPTGQERRQRR